MLFALMILFGITLIVFAVEFVDVVTFRYSIFKSYIKNEEGIRCEKISFSRFLEIFSKVQLDPKNNVSTSYGRYTRRIYVKNVFDIDEDYIYFVGDNFEKKYVFFNPINYFLYYEWLGYWCKRYRKRKDFDSKFVKGLFDDMKD